MTSAGFPLKILTPAHGESAQRTHGSPLPDETRRLCAEADGVLFGAAASPASPAVVSYLRWQQDAYAGVRPGEVLSRRRLAARESGGHRLHRLARELGGPLSRARGRPGRSAPGDAGPERPDR